MFACKFYKMFKSTFCTEHLWVTASVLMTIQLESLSCEILFEELVGHREIINIIRGISRSSRYTSQSSRYTSQSSRYSSQSSRYTSQSSRYTSSAHRDIQVSHRDIQAQLSDIEKCSNEFSDRYEPMHFELEISKSFCSIRYYRIVSLERNAVSNGHSLRKKLIEINQVPGTIPDSLIEDNYT